MDGIFIAKLLTMEIVENLKAVPVVRVVGIKSSEMTGSLRMFTQRLDLGKKEKLVLNC